MFWVPEIFIDIFYFFLIRLFGIWIIWRKFAGEDLQNEIMEKICRRFKVIKDFIDLTKNNNKLQ